MGASKTININRVHNTLSNLKEIVDKYHEGFMTQQEVDELLFEIQDFTENLSGSSTFAHMIHKSFKDIRG